jgi:hypothetical protein
MSNMSIVEWFERASAFDDSKQALAFIWAHPALLWSKSWPSIEEWIATRPPDERQYLGAHLEAVRKLGTSLEQNSSQWPGDVGPIELLAHKVISGERTLDQTLPYARTAEVFETLCPPYVGILARRATRDAINGSWQNAVIVFRLLLEALDALPPGGGGDEMRWLAGVEWIECAGAACHAVPDGRIFNDARQRGEALAKAEELAGRLQDAAKAWHRLGVLHLDPYAAGRTSRNFSNQILMWRQRLADLYGKSVTADPATAMPDPVEAFGSAIRFFELALPNRTGEARGRTLKALAEAIIWRELAGGPPDRKKARQCATEALTLLPTAKFPTETAVLNRLMRFANETESHETKDLDSSGDSRAGSPTTGAQLLWLDPKDVMDQYGATFGVERYMWRAREALTADPDIAVSLLFRLWPLLDGPQHESDRRSVVHDLANALVVLFHIDDRFKKNGNDFNRVSSELAQEAQTNDWTPGQFAAAIGALGLLTTSVDREDEGLEFVERAIKIADDANKPLAAILKILRANLIVGVAVNAYRAKSFGEATKQYCAALRAFVSQGMVETAMETLARVEDVTFGRENAAPVDLAVALAADAPMLASSGSPRLNERLQDVWNRVVGRTIGKQPMNLELFWLEMQCAKGALFATMLQRPERYDWRRDPDASALLARITQSRSISPDIISSDDEPIDDEMVLVSHVGARPIDQSDDKVSNLERRFDAHILRRMSDGSGALERVFNVEEFRKCIGTQTAFMSQFAGATEEGMAALITALLTDQTAFAAAGALQLPSAIVRLGTGDQTIEMGWFGLSVADLRRSIQEDPDTAIPILADHARNFLGGGLSERLAEMRKAGKDHLCIHPHGPLHFYPQHLIGNAATKQILADDWIVTYTPHPALLRATPPEAVAMKYELVSMGIDFKNYEPHGLPPLDNAVEEATIVSKVFGGRCWTNKEATKPRFLEALLGSRRLHLATHGTQDASAPAFQRLYLWPDQTSDGIFQAYEIVGLNLAHLDLVTLSACETSLGRFDISDTLRGLCASLFVAGVATIVSTLWAVEDNTASFFFECFYQHLRNGNPKLDAFRAAQTKTRQKFPAYRDWGAFQYSGRW